MKTCKKCKQRKPDCGFYKHKAMADGRLNFCKACVKKRVHKYRLTNIEKIRKYDRLRGKLPHRIALGQRLSKLRRFANPKKYRAQNAVNNALRDGKLKKPKRCESCGKKVKLCGHHEDYSKPLDVIWLCQICHCKIHN